MTVSLSLEITREAFLSQSNNFLTTLLQLPIPKTRLFISRLLFSTGLLLSNTNYNHAENAACIIDEAYLPRRCLAIVVLMSRALASQECVYHAVA
jgi:hypothetical protein